MTSNGAMLCGTGAHGFVGAVVQVAVAIIGATGWLGAFLVVGVENILPFIPSEVILPAIGFTAVNGGFGINGIPAIIVAILVVTLSSVVGATILFLVCRAIGIDRVSKIPFVNEDGLKKAERTFAKYGDVSVLFCRFLPVVRVLVTIPAGLSDMKKRSFITFTALGSLIWNSIFVVVGALMGSKWCSIEPMVSKYSKVVVIVLVVLFLAAWFLKKKVLKGKSE